jgi:hypothetical protein
MEELAALVDDPCDIEAQIMRSLADDMYVFECGHSQGRARLNRVYRELCRSGTVQITPARQGLSLLERLSDQTVNQYLTPESAFSLSSNLHRFLRARQILQSVQSSRRAAEDPAEDPDQSTNAQPTASESPRAVFMRAYRLYRSDLEIQPFAPHTPELNFSSEAVSEIRAAHEIFSRLAARDDICDEVWETVGLLMCTSAEPFLPLHVLPDEASRRERAAPIIAALYDARNFPEPETSAVAVAADESMVPALEFPTSRPPADVRARPIDQDGGDDYHSMLMALERSNRELLIRARTFTEDATSASNDYPAASARRNDARS